MHLRDAHQKNDRIILYIDAFQLVVAARIVSPYHLIAINFAIKLS